MILFGKMAIQILQNTVFVPIPLLLKIQSVLDIHLWAGNWLKEALKVENMTQKM